MSFRKDDSLIKEIKDIDMVDYLSGLGFKPTKTRNADYWYLSPLRDEKTPSFKINQKLNKWLDHGLGKGGNIIDFAILFYNCAVAELLHKTGNNFYFHEPLISRNLAESKKELKIKVLGEFQLSSFALFTHLKERGISIEIAEKYCREIRYQLNQKIFFGIGFKNDSGGYEIRNSFFKTGNSPKDITTFNNHTKEATVFEGFFDFLSSLTIHKNQEQNPTDFLVLNSVSFFEKARPFLELNHEKIRLYFDRDPTGQKFSQYALSLSPNI